MSRHVVCLGSALAMAFACASPSWSRQADSPPPATASAPNAPAAFRLIDQRPADEMQFRPLSRWMGSCDYGVWILPEKGGSAGRMDKMSADLKAALGPRLDGHEIVVNHYIVYVNMADQLTAGAMAVGGAVAGVYASYDGSARGAKCPRDRMKGGWYAGSEITSPYPPLIIEMDVMLDGQGVKARAVYSPPGKIIPMDKKFAKPALAGALQATLTKANGALAEEISARLN